MKIVLVAGTRPNFMKISPIIRAINKYDSSKRSKIIDLILVHAGQHYDYDMSKIFFEDLELPKPDIYLGVGSGTHAEQTAKVMIGIEKVILEHKPDVVMVVGDVNSTLAAALAAAKLKIPVAHVEAGLRSFDKSMPEEINRLLTDAISDFLFTPSLDANKNLNKEGISQEKIFFVGNVMVDSLLYNREKAASTKILFDMGLQKDKYAVLTLHRPSNVDTPVELKKILSGLIKVSRRIPIIFPCHPRTRKTIIQFGLENFFEIFESCASREAVTGGISLVPPMGYLDFMNLTMNCKFVMTDSGGIQEEATVLGIPCLTLRDTTERPITVTEGTNILVGNNTRVLAREAFKIINGGGKTGSCPKLWDGQAAQRIVAILIKAARIKKRNRP